MPSSGERGRRILIIAPFSPDVNGRHGGSRTIANLLLALAKHNHIGLAYVRSRDETPVQPDITESCDFVVEGIRFGTVDSVAKPLWKSFTLLPHVLRGRPIWVASRWDRRLMTQLQEKVDTWRPDIVQAEFTTMAAMLAELRGSFCRVVTDHETSSRSFPDRIKAAKGLSRWLWTVEANRWRTFERRALRQVDFVVTLSEADRDAFSAMHPDVPVEYVPIATRIPAEPLDALGVDPPQILFVGNFIHPPNVDAALRMASSIFPIVKSKVPDATLVIAGDHPPAELRALASPSVKVTGWVPDLTAYLNDAAVVVAPVRTGGGSRVKVAEALAHGKAVIGTSLAFAGLPVSSNEAVVVDSDNELATAIVHLLSDVSRRARIGRAARAFALAHLGADRTAAAYEALYDQIQR